LCEESHLVAEREITLEITRDDAGARVMKVASRHAMK
jgi:hypothetical protein